MNFYPSIFPENVLRKFLQNNLVWGYYLSYPTIFTLSGQNSELGVAKKTETF